MTCAMLSAGATRPRCIVPRFTPQRGSFPAGLLVACVFVCLCVSCVVCGGTGRRELTAAYRIIAAWNSALPGNRVPLPRLHRDWAHRCHICTGTGFTPASSAPGLGSPLLCPSARGACGLLFVCGQQGAATPAALKRRDLAQTLRGKDKTLEKAFFSDVEVRPPARRHMTPRDTCTASHTVPLAGPSVPLSWSASLDMHSLHAAQSRLVRTRPTRTGAACADKRGRSALPTASGAHLGVRRCCAAACTPVVRHSPPALRSGLRSATTPRRTSPSPRSTRSRSRHAAARARV
jgi:hypothetical protein